MVLVIFLLIKTDEPIYPLIHLIPPQDSSFTFPSLPHPSLPLISTSLSLSLSLSLSALRVTVEPQGVLFLVYWKTRALDQLIIAVRDTGSPVKTTQTHTSFTSPKVN